MNPFLQNRRFILGLARLLARPASRSAGPVAGWTAGSGPWSLGLPVFLILQKLACAWNSKTSILGLARLLARPAHRDSRDFFLGRWFAALFGLDFDPGDFVVVLFFKFCAARIRASSGTA